VRLADVPLNLRTCEWCGESFAVARKAGRPPTTCSEQCRKARGKNGPVRLTRHASRETGSWDFTPGERHTTDSGTDETGEALDALLSGSDDLAAGYSTPAEFVAETDDSGVYRRGPDGRVVTRFRNYFGEANASDASEESVTPWLRVIGQRDLPEDWQSRLDHGEPLADVVMTSWLGVDLSAI
jgi:hypothetical protein